MPRLSLQNGSATPASAVAHRRSTWRLIFRIVRWSTYAAALITLLMIFHVEPAPIIPTSPQAAARVEQKITAVEESVANGQPATLRLDETELNSYLASRLALAPDAGVSEKSTHTIAGPRSATPPHDSATTDPSAGVSAPAGSDAEQIAQARSSVRDVKIQLIDNRVRAYVVFDFHGKDLTLQLEGQLSSAGGYLRFEPISGQIGSLPLPESGLRSAIEKMMNSPENREKLKLPPEIADLRIENGELIATYR